jgi:hypothetical protein
MGKRAAIRTEPLRSGESIDRLPEEYRPGATLLPYAVWCAVSTLAGAVVLEGSLAVALSFFIAGPLAFVLQLFRAERDAVTVDPAVGLILADGTVIEWGQVLGVKERGIRHVFGTELYYRSIDAIGALWATTTPRFAGYSVLGTVGFVLVMLVYAFATGVLVPVMLLLSPWQHRVVVTLRSGERLEWRDLRKPGSFVRRVRAGILAVESDSPSDARS